MSLDVYLDTPDCPHCGADRAYSANITHNLTEMAEAAGIYRALWKPGEGATASDLIPWLRAGLEKLRADPDHFRTFDSPNGWGMYDHFVPFVERYLAACEANPGAKVRVRR